MKDDTWSVHKKSSVGLKSKMYTFTTEDNHESKAQKVLIKLLLIVNSNMITTKLFCSIYHIWDIEWTEVLQW